MYIRNVFFNLKYWAYFSNLFSKFSKKWHWSWQFCYSKWMIGKTEISLFTVIVFISCLNAVRCFNTSSYLTCINDIAIFTIQLKLQNYWIGWFGFSPLGNNPTISPNYFSTQKLKPADWIILEFIIRIVKIAISFI